jgi:hypothetical protein
MSGKESLAESAGDEDSLTDQAGETTAADMVSGPADTSPVGADTMVKVGAPSDGGEEGGRE